MFLVAGIDPGKSGGFAVFDLDKKELIDAGPLYFNNPGKLLLSLFHCEEILFERAQSAAGQANQGEYMRGFGRSEAAAMMTGAKIYYCSASWWKAKLSVPTNKNAAIDKALKLYPAAKKFVTLKKHDGIAEAVLIASILLNGDLHADLLRNNAAREKANAPKRRPSFRL